MLFDYINVYINVYTYIQMYILCDSEDFILT